VAAEYSAAPGGPVWIRHPFDGVRTDQIRALAATPARGRVGRRQRAHRSRTFLAILLGTILGGSIVLFANGALVVGGVGVGVCLRGVAAVASDSSAPPTLGDDAPRPRLFRDSIDVVRT
jgi:hypothetical protein